jgi:hypothetical protein
MADVIPVNGKVVGGQGGEGVLIESLVLKTDKGPKGDDRVWLEIGGTANTVLKSNYSPESGFDELPQAVAITARVDLLKPDRTMDFDIISRAFDLNPPLEDKEDEEYRFMEDGDKSVYSSILGKKAFFRAKIAKDTKTGLEKVGDTAGDFFWSLQPMAKTPAMKKESLKEVMGKIKAKRNLSGLIRTW